jgi:predicted anti-sigma-YlaC factor YlaD
MRRDDITCKECVDLLMDYLEQQLTPEARKRLDQHLSDCPPCIHFLKTYRVCSELAIKLRDQQVQIPLEVENRLKAFLRQEIGT